MKRLFFAIALLPGLLIACSVNKDKDQTATAETLSKFEETAATTTDSIATDQQADSDVPVTINWDRKIIKTANLRLEVKEHATYSGFLKAAVKKNGGYISREDNTNTDYKNETNLVIKVPVLQFEPLMDELSVKDAKQLERSITSEDVTGSIIDTKARLETRKATRSKYMEFLKQVGKVEDVLKVQQEINNIQEDIESAETRLAQLSGEAKYSTINLTYFEPKAGYNVDNETPGFGARLVTALGDGGRFFADIFIGLLTVWPLWLGIALLLFIVKRYRRNAAVVRKNI